MGGKSTMGLGRWSGPCREWSGPRVQGREMWGATHSCWQKWLLLLCNLRTRHRNPGPSPQTEPAVLPGASATILLLQCLIVLRKARRAKEQRRQCPLGLHMLGRSSGISKSWQARCFSPAAKTPVWAPRPAEDLESQDP